MRVDAQHVKSIEGRNNPVTLSISLDSQYAYFPSFFFPGSVFYISTTIFYCEAHTFLVIPDGIENFPLLWQKRTCIGFPPSHEVHLERS